MGNFEINQKVNTSGITRDALRKQCHKMSDEQFNAIWERFNVNGDDTLDEQEQVGMLAFLNNMAGDDETITRKEVRQAKNDTDPNNNVGDTKYKNYKRLNNAMGELSQTAVTHNDNEYTVNGSTYSVGENFQVNNSVKKDDKKTTTTTFDNKGNKTKETVDDGEGNTTVTSYYAVTTQIKPNTKKQETVTKKEGDFRTEVVTDFDADGKDTKTQIREYKTVNGKEQLHVYKIHDDKIVERFYTYDDNGNPKEMTVKTKNADGTLLETKKYSEWDENGIEKADKEIQQKQPVDKSQRPQKTTNSRINIPQEWKGHRLDEAKIKELELDEHENADQIFDIMIKHFELEDTYKNMSETDKKNLKADFIKYNPSMFNADGKIHGSANWARLDFPRNALDKYKDGKKPELPKPAPKPVAKPAAKPAAAATQKDKQTKATKTTATTQTQTKAKPSASEQQKIDEWNKNGGYKIVVNQKGNGYELSTYAYYRALDGTPFITPVTASTVDELRAAVNKKCEELKKADYARNPKLRHYDVTVSYSPRGKTAKCTINGTTYSGYCHGISSGATSAHRKSSLEDLKKQVANAGYKDVTFK